MRAAMLIAVLLTTTAVHAAEVRVEVSSREVYVGEPIVFSVEVVNARAQPTPPTLPEIPGATSRSTPRMNTLRRAINGRVTSTVTFTYRIIPEQVGTLTIPSLNVVVDGETRPTAPQQVAVVKPSTVDNDKLIVELTASRSTLFLGEPLDVRLSIWVLPYRDRQYDLRLDEGQTWQLLSLQDSRWGLFVQPLNEMLSKRQRPQGIETLRDDGQGGRRAYYRFDLRTTIWPDRVGELDLGENPVSVSMSYPTQLRRRRSLLGSSYAVASARPLRVTARPAIVDVKRPPLDGRPASFNGAVGSFDFQVRARPVDVAVGDPIELDMVITDRRDSSRLEVLGAPPLDVVPELTSGFRVSDDPIAGEVSGPRKRFTQTIRARRDDVDRIPPIPFTFFDPQTEQYVTRSSAAIPITVAASTELAMSDVVAAERPPVVESSTELTQAADGLFAIVVDPDRVLAVSRSRPAGWTLALLAVPPLFYAVLVGVQHRRRRLRDDTGYARLRKAARMARRRIAEAERGAADELAPAVGTALSGYVADRCNLATGQGTRVEVTQALETRRAPQEIVDAVGALLAACEAQRYAGAAAGDPASLAEEARSLIARLERERLR